MRWCIPKVSSEFVAAMGDVLELYAEPRDPERPVVCFEETSTQLLAHITEPLLAKPGQPRREDYEYQRAGTRNLFLTCQPRLGCRHVAITRQRTMEDFAHQMRCMVDEANPDIPVTRVVLDNPNTHRMASLYETLPPDLSPENRSGINVMILDNWTCSISCTSHHLAGSPLAHAGSDLEVVRPGPQLIRPEGFFRSTSCSFRLPKLRSATS